MQFGKNDHFISGTFPVSTLHQMRVRGVQIESRFGCVAHRRFFCPVFQFQFCPTCSRGHSIGHRPFDVTPIPISKSFLELFL